MANEILTLVDGESLLFGVDFSSPLDTGESLTGTPTVVEHNTSDLTIGTPSISGDQVVFRVSGGTVRKTYCIKVTVSTTDSNTRIEHVYLHIGRGCA